MFSILKNQRGRALIGLMIAAVFIAGMFFGSSFFGSGSDANNTNDTNILDTYKDAVEDVADIQNNIEEGNEVVKEVDKENSDNSSNDDKMVSSIGNDVVKVFNISKGDNLISPVTIEGVGVAFENTLIVELRNQDHKTMIKKFTTIKSPEAGVSGPFKITLNFDFNNTKEGFVAVYEESAKDGSEQNLVEIPVGFGGNENF